MNENRKFEHIEAIQFNGWNFGAIYDWIRDTQGLYTSDFKNEIELNDEIVHRNDWVVKEENGAFSIMSNCDFQERIDKMK